MIAVALVATGVAGCATSRHLDDKLPWYGENRDRLDLLIQSIGKAGGRYDPGLKPVATFDWDNTVIRNDSGDATLYWMIAHDKIHQPPGKDWKQTSSFLTPDAAAALDAACGTPSSPGQPLPTSTNINCASEILTIYGEGKTLSGKPAFAGYNHRRMEPRYYWGAALQAGWTPAEVRDFARAALQQNIDAPVGATQKIGSVEVAAWVRYYDPMKDLIHTLKENGFDVWIISASSQPIIEAFAEKIGLDANHVIGVRSIIGSDGRITYDLQGCGDVRDGANAIIPYIDGKRCWINKAVFGDDTPTALLRSVDPARRPALAAGDADTDVTFLQDATGLRLVINRQRPELMCNAYEKEEGNWLVNPMFISPLPRKFDKYPCSTTACTDEAGAPVPCKDDAGKVIPDQEDRVYPGNDRFRRNPREDVPAH